VKHRVAGRKLGRTSAHRLALLRNLSTALFDKERVRTTLSKAKELRPFAERLVSLSKRETLHARRRILRHIHDRRVVAKLFDTISARYAQRPGGYTRILRLGPRRGDNAELALIELVGAEVGPAAEADADGKKGKGKGKAAAKAKGKGKAPAAPATEGEGKAKTKAKAKAKTKPKKAEAAPAKKAKAAPKKREAAKSDKPVARKSKAKGKKQDD
jgi:large subunit ribosomal protein L17